MDLIEIDKPTAGIITGDESGLLEDISGEIIALLNSHNENQHWTAEELIESSEVIEEAFRLSKSMDMKSAVENLPCMILERTWAYCEDYKGI